MNIQKTKSMEGRVQWEWVLFFWNPCGIRITIPYIGRDFYDFDPLTTPLREGDIEFGNMV